MPTLGFLKKKRTRDSNPPSPIRPAAADRNLETGSGFLPVSSRSSLSQAPPSSSGTYSTRSFSSEKQPMNNLPGHQPTFTPPTHSPSPGTDPQSLPSIANLINPPLQHGLFPSPLDSPYPRPRPDTPIPPGTLGIPSGAPSGAPGGPSGGSPGGQPFHPAAMAQPPPLQQQQQQQQQLPPPDQVRVTKGKYTLVDFEIQRTLGTGSFGRVHLVQSRHNQRFYAIKVLKKTQVVKMKQVEHTNDERRMLGQVKNTFLITLWGTFQDARNLYMVMDFVEGGELFSLLRKSGRFPNPVAKFYAAEVTLALEYLHKKNIIYRDLKPENLLLDRHGHLKITDFGFAKRVPDKTWTLCGTPDYLAPEVVSNKGYNKSVDWWSLGILVYEMLCGYTPFWDNGSPMKIYENILRGKIKYPAYINPDAHDLLERLITADLTKRLGNLYGGAQDVKSHPWFAEVTWDRLARKDIDAPYTPPVRPGAGDASQFDRYPEETEQYGQAGNDDYGHHFPDF